MLLLQDLFHHTLIFTHAHQPQKRLWVSHSQPFKANLQFSISFPSFWFVYFLHFSSFFLLFLLILFIMNNNKMLHHLTNNQLSIFLSLSYTRPFSKFAWPVVKNYFENSLYLLLPSRSSGDALMRVTSTRVLENLLSYIVLHDCNKNLSSFSWLLLEDSGTMMMMFMIL